MIREGVGFLRRRRPLQASFLADIIAMIFGMPMAVLPAVAAERYGGNDISLGFLYSAVPTGMVLAALLSGWTRRVHRHGLGVIASVCVWGVAITLFAVTGPFWLSFLMLAVAGAGDAISGVFRMSILQTGTPPEMMGRLMGMGMAVWAAGPALGDAEAGLVAELTTTDIAIASGGLACVVGILALARLWPEFRHYDITRARATAAAEAVTTA
jgi:MFS family permease